MRRKDREVTDRAAQLAILEDCDVCRIGLVDQGRAYIVPMNFGWHEADDKLTLYFHCAKEGRKLAIMGEACPASFEADCSHQLVTQPTCAGWTFRYRSVMGEGTLRRVETRAEQRLAMACLMAHYGGSAVPAPTEAMLDSIVVLALDVTILTAKANQP